MEDKLNIKTEYKDLKRFKKQKINKNLHKHTNHFKRFEQLSPRHQKAIELRLNAVKYKEIAEELKVKEITVRLWFAKGGICHDVFENMKKERTKEREDLFNQIDKKLKDIAVDAVVVLENAVRKGNWKAAVKALEMAGFEPVHKVADVTEDEKAKTLEVLKDFFTNGGQNQSNNKSISTERQAGDFNTPSEKNI